MRPAIARLTAACLLAALVAGCTGAQQTPHSVEVAPGQVVEVDKPVDPGNGMVAGIVGDDAVYPLKGVFVVIAGLGLNATTDGNGRFAIVDVPPGIYLLQGSEKDHATMQTTVEVEGGKVARAVLLLPRIPSTDPYHTTYRQDKFTDFQAAGIVVGGNTTGGLEFGLDQSKAATVVMESSWSGTLVGTDDKPLTYDLSSGDGKSILAGRAANPFTLPVDARILPPSKARFYFSVGPDIGLAVESRGQTFVTVFYNEPAPDGWSVLKGDV